MLTVMVYLHMLVMSWHIYKQEATSLLFETFKIGAFSERQLIYTLIRERERANPSTYEQSLVWKEGKISCQISLHYLPQI